MSFITLLFFILSTVYEGKGNIVLSRYSPWGGSANGATTVSIFGVFDNPFKPVGPIEDATQVIFVGDYQEYVCDVEKDSTRKDQITCYTRAMPYGYYKVCVEIGGERKCFGNKFNSYYWLTPKLNDLRVSNSSYNFAGSPRDLITVVGDIFTDIYSPNDERLLSRSNNRLIRRISAGPGDCSLTLEGQSDVLYDLRFAPEEQAVTGLFTCKPGSNFVGNSNFSFIISEMGRALPSSSVMRVSAHDRVYMFQTYAEIQDVSPRIGSVMGGTEIVISGNFFGTDEVSLADVTILGQSCMVISQSDTEIRCRTPPEPMDLPPLFSGSRGVLVEKWVGEYGYGDLNILRQRLDEDTAGYSAWYQDSAGYKYDETYTTVKISGLLEIQKSDYYQFIVRCDDPCEVFIGNSSSDLENVVDNSGYTLNSWTHRSGQSSEWFYYEKGRIIYYEGIGVNYNGPGELSLGVLRGTTTLTNSQSGNVINDRQIYYWTTSFKKDIQHVSLINWSPSAGVDEQQTITVESNCSTIGYCGAAFYRLSHNGAVSGPILADAHAYDLQHTLSQLMSADVMVSVTEQTMTDAMGTQIGKIYQVTFAGGMGDEQELVVEEQQGAVVTVEEFVKGLANFENFALEFLGRTTGKLSVHASASDVEAAVLETINAKCPPELLGNSDSVNYYAVLDFEGSKPRGYAEQGTRVSYMEAFCGRNSLQNPYYLFATDWSHFEMYNVGEYPYVCFAHIGIFQSQMRLRFLYIDGPDVDTIRTKDTWFFKSMITMQADQWQYDCFDLESEILQQYPSFTDIKMLRIGGFSRVSNENNFYIDAFTISSSVPDPDLPGLVAKRISPATWQGEVMSSIEVLKKNESVPEFEIKISPYNCAYGLPLISVYNARHMRDSSEDFSSPSASNWPSNVFANISRTEKTNKPMTGTFDLNYQDDEIGPVSIPNIPIQITKEDLESLLETIDGFGDMAVTRYGSDHCYRRRFHVEWRSNGGRKGKLQIDDSRIMGDDDLTFSYRQIHGGALHGPFPGEMTRKMYSSPQVEVKINKIQSLCNGNCSFFYSEAMTPEISNISPNHSGVAADVTITGTNLDGNGSTLVLIGNVECEVVTESPSSIVCTVGEMEFGVHKVVVYVGGKGLARHIGGMLTYKQHVVVSNVSPRNAFTTGGIPMTITGRGLGYDIEVSIGPQPCPVISASATEYVCTVPMSANETSFPITIETSDGITNHGLFTYSNVGLPIVTSVQPTIIQGSGGVNMTIAGSDFGNTIDGVTVMLGNHECEIVTISDASILVTTPYLPSGYYMLEILFENLGQADTNTHSIPLIQYVFTVTGIQPKHVSLFGGSQLTISGEGFSEDDVVTLGKIPCSVETATVNTITCITGSSAKRHIIDNNGIHATYGIGYAWNPPVVTITQGDTVVWKWDLIVHNTLGIQVYQTSGPSDTRPNGGFTSTVRSQTGSYAYTFSNPGVYYFSTGTIDNLDLGSLSLNGAVWVQPFSDIPSRIKVTNNGIDADINMGPPLLFSQRSARSVSCSPLNSPIPGCNSRKKRDIILSRQRRTVGTPVPMTQADIDEFIHGHNMARKMAMPSGSNIILARWDDELAAQAESWATGCVFAHSGGHNHSVFGASVGENIASFSSNWDVATLVNSSVAGWVSEEADYTFSSNSCAGVCGHYTQVVWHDSYAVGCGISNCVSNFTVVCQYGRAGNYGGEKPYTAGPSCSNCSFGFTDCDPTYGLCVEDNDTTVQPTTPSTSLPTTSTPEEDDSEIIFSTCFTPIVTSIYPQSGTVNDTIEIQGTGFGNDSCQVTVDIGDDISCDVLFADSTMIICSPLPTGDAPIAIAFEVTVNILGYGEAFIDIISDMERRFALLPYVESIEPDAGSVEGGTLINITGSGFYQNADVFIGPEQCTLLSVSYNFIQCVTPNQAAGSQPLSVIVQGVYDAVCDPCTFEYSSTLTSVVTGISPALIISDNTEIHLTGNNFFSSPVVTIDGNLVHFDDDNDDSLHDLGTAASIVGGYICTVIATSESCINCTLSHLPAGSHELAVLNPGIGFADISTSAIITGATLAILDPVIGGTGGGLEVTVIGHGFLSEDLSIAVDGNSAEIVENSISNMQFTFITPPGQDGMSTVQINSNSVSYTAIYFEYSAAITPTITAMSPLTGDVGDSVNLYGTLLNGSITVYFGDAPCNVTFHNATMITCTVSEPTSGATFPPIVFIEGTGYADHNSLEFTYVTDLTVFSPLQGSLGGGNMLTIQGSGFHDYTTVFIGRSVCFVSSITYNTIDCEIEETPSMSTREDPVTSSHISYEGQGITVFESIPYDFHYALGQAAEICFCEDNVAELITATGAGALEAPLSFITDDLGSISIVTPESSSPSYICLGSFLMANPVAADAFDNYMCVHHMLVEETTVTLLLHVVSLYIWQIDGSPFVTFTSSADPPVAYKLKDLTQPIADISAPVQVILGLGNSLFSSVNYTFTSSLTPVVNNVSPSRGGTGGGTNITITGSGFSNTVGDVSVTIDGIVCDVQSASTTEINCTTNASNRSIETSVVVHIAGKGQSLDVGAQFFYVDVWSSKYTWGGRGVPGDGALVTIPKGQDIMIDINTGILKMLLILGGRVFFDEKDIELNTENILIMDGGRLEVGTEDKPFQHKGIITLHGHVRSIEIPIYGAKGIGIREGTLDLHGQHVPITWTLLAQTAEVGDQTIVVKHPVTWNVGDAIVIASTGDRVSQRENEQLTITSVDSDGMTIHFVEDLKYKHLGVTEVMPDGTVLQTAAEVGLLTRNVVVRGSRHDEWDEVIPACPDGFNPGEFAVQTCFLGRFGEERGSDQFGAQILFHHPDPNNQEAFGRISYVEMYHMGQAFRLGRYAIHYHLMGDMNYKNYVRGCSIHESYNRAVTIHDTHKALVEKNVVYNAMGGCIFIEDGTETENVVRENLIVFCRQSTSLQNEDITPAAIWVTNPNNIIEHNAAAGGTHFGYWYRMHDHPSGPSATTSICPKKIELGSFKNNTAHSQGWFGLWIFQAYTPKQGSCCNCAINAITAFKGLTAWNCDKGAEFVQTGSVQLRDSVLYNNRLSGIEVKMMISPQWGETGIYNSVIIGHTSVSKPHAIMKSGVTLPYTDGWETKNVTFINFNRPGGTVFSTATITGTCAGNCGGFHSRFEDIVYHSVTNIGNFRWEHENYIEDVDGSLTGSNVPKVVIAYTDTAPPTCFEKAELSRGSHPGMECPHLRLHRIAWNNVLPSSLDGSLVNLTNAYGTTQVPFEKKRMTHAPGWMALLFDGMTYDWVFHHLPKMSNITYSALLSNYRDGECNIITHRLTSNPDRFNIISGQDKNSTDMPLDCSVNVHGDYYFNDVTKTLQYIVTGENLIARRKRAGVSSTNHWADPNALNRAVAMNTFRCYFKDCTPPPDPNTVPPERERPNVYDRWSDAAYWPSGVLPGDGEPVTIRTGDWLVADVPLPNITTLWIDGVLELEGVDENTLELRNFTLRVDHIVIRGGRLIIGWEDNKMYSFVDIILTGTRDSDELPLTQEVTLGAKAIGAFGGLDLHGADIPTVWSHLSETAVAGSTEIKLDEHVQWKEGQDILITPTGFNPWEAETFEITGVREEAVTNNTILELNGTLQYNHLAEDYSYSNASFGIVAEVGLLTRNIRIIGDEYINSDEESFGGRILVGKLEQSEATFIGYARIENVQFIRMGQEGYSESSDPRFSLAYLDTGTQDLIRPSYVRKCSFVRNFNTAYGAFGANSITYSNNIIYHTVGPSIRVEGLDNRIENNLVSLMINPGTYNGKTNFIWYWFGAIQVYSANSLILSGNVVAGSERAAYWIGGESCSNGMWGVNIARSSLYGIYINKFGEPSCTMIRNFHIHHSYDFGIYYQDRSSAEIKNCIITDSGVGIITLFNGPGAHTHLYEEKYAKISNVALIAVTKPGICPTIDTTAGFMLSSPNARPPNNVLEETIGILAPSFMSSHNVAPKKPFAGLMQYPALGGKMIIDGTTFINFGDNSCSGVSHIVISTNKKNEDYHHPIFVSQISFDNTPTSSKVFFGRPSLGKINPSDCVDMECDGLKNIIITDTDGTFLGSPGDIIPQAEYEWNGDASRGLGDYRIPITLLTYPNGSRIPVDDIAPNKGILRANMSNTNCMKKSAWQAYECHGYDHQLFLIESLDADTETRRLSPVALLADGYIDLENGPQDHGWCAGYTCQLRLSTFFTTVAVGYEYEIHFTGTSPSQLRLRLPHAGPDDAVVACIYYSTSNRLDVYHDGQYILPTNAYYQGSKVLTRAAPLNQPDLYKPNVTSPTASNLYSRLTQTICVTVKGPSPVDIQVSSAIYLGIGFPAVTEDEFFENIAENLAILLNIPPENVWVVDIVREGSRRRRKRAGTATVTFGIGQQPSQNSTIVEKQTPRSEVVEDENGTVTIVDPGEPDPATTAALEAEEATRAELELAKNTIAAAVESGKFDEVVENISFSGVTISSPPPVATAENPLNETNTPQPAVLTRIDHLEITNHPRSLNGRAGDPIRGAAKLRLVDETGFTAHPVAPWTVTATILTGDSSASIIVGKDETMVNGMAEFKDLTIDMGGHYTIIFSASSVGLSEPAFIAVSKEFYLRPPRVPTNCTDEEGEDYFDREYVWERENCSYLCTYDCDGYDEECVDVLSCGSHSECINDECECDISDFDPHLPENLLRTLEPHVICGPSYMKLIIDKCGANEIGFNLEKMFLFGEGPVNTFHQSRGIRSEMERLNLTDHPYACQGRVENTPYGLKYSFKVKENLNQCNPDVIDNGTHIAYHHILRAYKTQRVGNILRDRPIEVRFTCYYESNSQESLPSPIEPYISVISVGVESEGSFNITMSLWEDDGYTIPMQSPSSVLVPDPLRVSIVANGVNSIVLSVKNCSAYSSEDPATALTATLIDDGCPNVAADVVITEIGISNVVRFWFPSFLLTNQAPTVNMDGSLYLECYVIVCTQDLAPCTPNCGSTARRKRDTGSQSMITLGPIPVGGVAMIKRQRINKRGTTERAGTVEVKWVD